MDQRTQALTENQKAKPASAGFVNRCCSCIVCGGSSQPGEDRLCSACRSLAATFAAATAPRAGSLQ